MGGKESIPTEHANQDGLYSSAVDQFGSALERLARAYEADPEKRRDLSQDIHFQLWRSFQRYDGRCSLRTWVYRVANHVATSHVIRERRIFSSLVTLEELETLPDKVEARTPPTRPESGPNLSLDSKAQTARSPGHRLLSRRHGRGSHRRNHRIVTRECSSTDPSNQECSGEAIPPREELCLTSCPRRIKKHLEHQPTETSPMTLKLVQSKARELQAKTRRKLLGTVAGPLAASFFYAFGIREFAPLGKRAAPIICVRARLESGGTVFPKPGNVVNGDAGRRGTQHRSGVLPGRNRASAKPATPSSSMVVGPATDGNRNIRSRVGNDWDQRQGTISECASLSGSRSCLDNRLLRHESAGTA